MIFLSFQSLACDICNMTVSLTPDDSKNTFSLLYRNRITEGTFTRLMFYVDNSEVSRHSGVDLTSVKEEQNYKESFSIYEAQGKFNISKKFNVFFSLPIISNERTLNGNSQFTVTGIGDPILIARYNAIKTNNLKENSLNHRLTIGTGVKIPLGKYDFKYEEKIVEHDIQAGTGTLDFIFTLDYMFKYKNIGFMINSSYKANTLNKKVDYMFGNTTNSTLSVFYMKKINENFAIMPSIGVYYEHADKDIEYKEYEDNSGGDIVFSSVGVNFFYKKTEAMKKWQRQDK
mgnify:CR=1 FL=1